MGSREKILQSAMELFYHVGYQTTSVDDILAHCGVAKSNFYYHFKTKEELAFVVLEHRVADYEIQTLDLLHDASQSPSERLRQFLARVCQAQVDVQKMAGCPFGNFAAALPSVEDDARNERFRLRLSQLFRRMEAAVGVCLAEGAACGDFRDDIPPSEMAAFLVATMQGLLMLTKTHRDTAPLFSGMALAQKLLRAR